ncbi:dNA protecting protein DprA [Clostridium sp. CAG:492]|nr:dNA protecting protein DprA [Clostridium sp. CAG:492]
MFINKKIYELYLNNPTYSDMLRKIPSSPKKLYAIGNIGLLKEKSISIVGSRNSSEYGRKITKSITKDLVEDNIVIVSGMASGIDSVAHKTCLEYGGKTIAVLGSGFRHIFPKENEQLFHQIIESDGLVISEYPIDTPVQMKNFPKRNRIISGLSMGLLVIEAAYRSGTSITAKYARMQGRKVFCIPNSIGNKNSYGTINLVQNGAILVKNAQDILNVLGVEYKKNGTKTNFKQLELLDNNSKKIFDCISNNEEIDAEGISIQTKLDISKVNELLTILEIDEVIKSVGINKFKICEEYYE